MEKDGKISWTYKITNEEVLERVGTDRQLINALRNMKKELDRTRSKTGWFAKRGNRRKNGREKD